MTSVYLIRHAQAQGNLEGRFQGSTDLPLTDLGHKQAGLLAQRMRAIPLSAIYTSPLQRAFDTAAPVAETHKLTPIRCEGLSEIDGGAMENRLFTELEVDFKEDLQLFSEEPHLFMGIGGGESIPALYDRMQRTVLELVHKHAGSNIAVVSHGTALRCFLCYANGLPIEQIKEVPWGKNTCVSHVIFDQNFAPHVYSLFDDSHLRDEKPCGCTDCTFTDEANNLTSSSETLEEVEV